MADKFDQVEDTSEMAEDLSGTNLFEEPEDFLPARPPPFFATHTLRLQPSKQIPVRILGYSPLEAHNLWNGGRICTNYLESNPSLFQGKSVLEFGAAAGLPSLICAGLGAKTVVVTDFPDGDIIENLEYNKLHSFASSDASASEEEEKKKLVLPKDTTLHCKGHRWGDTVEPLVSLSPSGSFDLLLLCDVVYNHSAHAQLLQSLQLTLSKPAGIALVFFTPYRTWFYERDLKFFDLARETGELDVELIAEERLERPMFEGDRGDLELQKMVFGYKITWKKNLDS